MFASPLTPKIQVEPLGDGVRYHLARRDVGPLRWLGLVPLAIGVGVLIALATAALLVWRTFAEGSLPPERPANGPAGLALPWPLLLFAAIFGLIFLKAAFSALRFGLILLAGTSEIVLSPGRLTLLDRGGPLSKRETIPLEAIRLLRIERLLAGASPSAAGRGATPPTGPLARLVAIPERGKARTLAIGYPSDELAALAADLANRLPAATLSADGAIAAPPRIERVEAPTSAFDRTPRFDPAGGAEQDARADRDRELADRPPEGTSITVSRIGNLEIVAPATGLFRGSHGLALFGLVWILFTVGILTAVLIAKGSEAVPLVMLPVFVSIGGLMLYLGARMGLRTTRIELAPPHLRIARATFGRARTDDLPIADLRSVTVGPSGFEINNRPVPELKLRLADGGEIGLLRERRPEELAWLAALLRDELRARGVAAFRAVDPSH